MKIETHHEETYDIRFDLILQTRNVELHARLSDELDLASDIRQVLQDANRTIGQLIRTTPKQKQCHG